MPANTRFDVLGLGVAAVDDLFFVQSYPVADTKVRVSRKERHGGGLTATALVAAARLGSTCAYAGALGSDELSVFAREGLKAEGVDLSWVADREDARPIHATVIVDREAHTRTILLYGEGICGAVPNWPPEEVITGSRVLFVDYVGPEGVLRAARIASGVGIPIVADAEGGSGVEHEELMHLVDHLIVTSEYASRVTGREDPGEAVVALWHEGRQAVVATCGKSGAWYVDAGAPGRPRHQRAFSVDVVDTTGCGDVFHGAYASGLARGLDMAGRMELASAAAALKATRAGGQSGAPTLAEVEAFLREVGS